MNINSSDLLGTASVQASMVARNAEKIREQSQPNTLELLDQEITRTMQVLAELCVARFGIVRRNPTFRDGESDLRIQDLTLRMELALREVKN